MLFPSVAFMFVNLILELVVERKNVSSFYFEHFQNTAQNKIQFFFVCGLTIILGQFLMYTQNIIKSENKHTDRNEMNHDFSHPFIYTLNLLEGS